MPDAGSESADGRECFQLANAIANVVNSSSSRKGRGSGSNHDTANSPIANLNSVGWRRRPNHSAQGARLNKGRNVFMLGSCARRGGVSSAGVFLVQRRSW